MNYNRDMGVKILTTHPRGKNGVNIDRKKYNIVRAAILEVLSSFGEVTFMTLMAELEDALMSKFDGSIGWYTTTVNLTWKHAARSNAFQVPNHSVSDLLENSSLPWKIDESYFPCVHSCNVSCFHVDQLRKR